MAGERYYSHGVAYVYIAMPRESHGREADGVGKICTRKNIREFTQWGK